MMISVYEVLGAMFSIAFCCVFLQGIAEKTEGYLYANYLIGGGGMLVSGSPAAIAAYLFLLVVQTYFVVKGDTYWKKGVAIYVGEDDGYVRDSCAYEVKVRKGERYIILQLSSGKTYYYEDTDEFLCFWKVSEDFCEIRELLGLTTDAS